MDQIIEQNEQPKIKLPGPWHQSRIFIWTLKGLVVAIAALLVFQLGMFVGFRKASFSFGWGDNYHRVFGGPQGGLMHDFSGQDFMNGHGIYGMIAQIGTDNLIIKGSQGAEINIVTNDRTSIVRGRSRVGLSDLKPGDLVTVIGRPQNNGVVMGEIIRILPSNRAPDIIPMMPRVN